jgi:tRNA G18 (ribose-2'-O)-methylase SpoU
MDNDSRNVLDRYKSWETEVIKDDVQRNSFPYACLMSNIEGDFNISSVFRNGNAFGCGSLFYFGKKKWDKRGAVGVNHYSSITHLPSIEDVEALLENFTFVALECNAANVQKMYSFDWQFDKPVCIVVGSESDGIDPRIMQMCKAFVEIPMYGSVRSVNAAVASGIAMCDIVAKRFA